MTLMQTRKFSSYPVAFHYEQFSAFLFCDIDDIG